jgi:predicted metalloprotease with PDZ domain
MHAPRLATVLLFFFPLACAASPKPAAEPAAPGADDLELALTLETEPLALELALAFPGDVDGETWLEISESWGGVGPMRKDLEELRMATAAGQELSFEAAAPHRWRVRHAPAERLVVRARLAENRESFRSGFRERSHYRPILEPGLLHAIGHLFLPLPDHLDWNAPRRLFLNFPGFAEAGWQVADSFGTGALPRCVRASPGELRAALFVAGDLELVRPSEAPGLVVAAARHGFAFDATELGGVAAEILAIERELMRDAGARHYLVSAIGVGEPAERGFSYGGTGLSNAFALFLQPGARLGLADQGGLELRRLLAHEGFHEWNGVRLPLAEPEESCYWFSEGFTDFFARLTLRQAGWLDDEGYAADLSRRLQEYHLSPARNLDAKELGERFWSDPEAQRQPYVRGDLVACLLDHALRQDRDARSDLPTFLRTLLQEAREAGQLFDAPTLLARIAEHTDAATAEEIRRVVVDGETLELPEDAFGAGFRLVERTVFAFDPGFDIEGSFARKSVYGVRPEGPAALAGLVEGEEIRGLSVFGGDSEQPVEVTVAKDGVEREIRFLPRGAPAVVPAVELVAH